MFLLSVVFHGLKSESSYGFVICMVINLKKKSTFCFKIWVSISVSFLGFFICDDKITALWTLVKSSG
jgi:hypothetical protein